MHSYKFETLKSCINGFSSDCCFWKLPYPHFLSVQVGLVWVTSDELKTEKSSFAYRTAVSQGIKLALDFIPMGL